jgi:hypothetical protein
MTKHVISTLAADQKYASWETHSGVGTILRSVYVKGGASVASPGSGAIITPEGVSTTVSDEDAKFLAEHPEFQKHQERGFVKIVGPALDANSVAQKMSKDDGRCSVRRTSGSSSPHTQDLLMRRCNSHGVWGLIG